MKYYFPNLIILTLMVLMTASTVEAVSSEDIEVGVQINGENVIVDLSMNVSATPQQAWAVLTDFDHMSGFISNVKESRVLSTYASTQKVFQRGEANFGMLSFPFESTRELQLTPFDRIQSHMISGSMRKMDGSTQLKEEGGLTRIIFHSESIPGNWIPPIVGKTFIEHETREQFLEIRNEIMKRKLSSGAVSNPADKQSAP